MAEYNEGDVYICADSSCHIEVTVTKGCTEEECPTCSPLICCDKPMVKKS